MGGGRASRHCTSLRARVPISEHGQEFGHRHDDAPAYAPARDFAAGNCLIGGVLAEREQTSRRRPGLDCPEVADFAQGLGVGEEHELLCDLRAPVGRLQQVYRIALVMQRQGDAPELRPVGTNRPDSI